MVGLRQGVRRERARRHSHHARADGLRVVAVTTGPFTADALAEADHVASGAAELRPLLDALAA